MLAGGTSGFLIRYTAAPSTCMVPMAAAPPNPARASPRRPAKSRAGAAELGVRTRAADRKDRGKQRADCAERDVGQ